MRLKHLLKKFEHAFDLMYGGIQARTKAAAARLETPVQTLSGTFDSAMAAQVNRDLKHGEKHRAKKNTRGLPKGYSVHEANRARLLQRSKKHREAAAYTSLNAAQTFLDDLKACNSLRARLRRPRGIEAGRIAGRGSRSFLKTAMPAWSRLNLQELVTKVRLKMQSARDTGRVPYTKPKKKPAMQRARVVHKPDGSMVVTPQPLPLTGVC